MGNIPNTISACRIAIMQSRANRNLGEARERALNTLGLTLPEWFVLGYVADETSTGGVSVGDIAAMLDVQSTYITALLRKLEAKKLIQLQAGQDDRRVRIITVTQEGATLANQAEAALAGQMSNWLPNISPAAMNQYLAMIEALAAGMPA